VNLTLQELYLQDNFIGALGASAIAEALEVNSSLCLNEEVGDSGAAAIAEALKVNSSLHELSLASSRIGDSGAVAIARALCQNSMLQKLDVRGTNIKHAGAAAFEGSLEGSLLRLTGHFPEVLHYRLTRNYRFLYALSEKGFRLFIMNDVPPAIWPHALAKVACIPHCYSTSCYRFPGVPTF
jgi:hypothetical protein